jgi:hypothetical protein
MGSCQSITSHYNLFYSAKFQFEPTSHFALHEPGNFPDNGGSPLLTDILESTFELELFC